MGQFLQSNHTNATDMNNSKINKVIQGKNISRSIKINNTSAKKASKVKEAIMISRDTNVSQNRYTMSETSISTPQVQQIVTYEMNIISL